METRKINFKRTTNETDISMEMDADAAGKVEINTTLPFMDHMLTAMAFHGHFSLTVNASGDTDVDPHHLVEDLGLVLGELLAKLLDRSSAIKRFAYVLLPMDEALAEVVIDVCGRPTLVYRAPLPQPCAGNLDLSLLREFFTALAGRSKISLHIDGRYGENSHHIMEAVFKALGKAIKQAYTPEEGKKGVSTKGTLA